MIARELIALPDYAGEVIEGLTRCPKSLPCKLFYDAAGSALFEEITRLPEYYLTRSELEILRDHAGEIAHALEPGVAVVELGAGTAAKTCTLLQALGRRQLRVDYVPVDISPAALGKARARVQQQCAGTYVKPVVADFSNGFGFLRNIPSPKLVLYLGSSIGNFAMDDAIELLASVREELAPRDALLLGTDLAKDPAILVPAYDDPRGVTAEFNKNLLRRINQELSADFAVEEFQHIARWNPGYSCMDMYLECMRAQVVHFPTLSLDIEIEPRERIHTESSYKYTMEMVDDLVGAAGFKRKHTFFDQRKWFALHLAHC